MNHSNKIKPKPEYLDIIKGPSFKATYKAVRLGGMSISEYMKEKGLTRGIVAKRLSQCNHMIRLHFGWASEQIEREAPDYLGDRIKHDEVALNNLLNCLPFSQWSEVMA